MTTILKRLKVQRVKFPPKTLIPLVILANKYEPSSNNLEKFLQCLGCYLQDLNQTTFGLRIFQNYIAFDYLIAEILLLNKSQITILKTIKEKNLYYNTGTLIAFKNKTQILFKKEESLLSHHEISLLKEKAHTSHA